MLGLVHELVDYNQVYISDQGGNPIKLFTAVIYGFS
jgi:hypothetical protein